MEKWGEHGEVSSPPFTGKDLRSREVVWPPQYTWLLGLKLSPERVPLSHLPAPSSTEGVAQGQLWVENSFHY